MVFSSRHRHQCSDPAARGHSLGPPRSWDTVGRGGRAPSSQRLYCSRVGCTRTHRCGQSKCGVSCPTGTCAAPTGVILSGSSTGNGSREQSCVRSSGRRCQWSGRGRPMPKSFMETAERVLKGTKLDVRRRVPHSCRRQLGAVRHPENLPGECCPRRNLSVVIIKIKPCGSRLNVRHSVQTKQDSVLERRN